MSQRNGCIVFGGHRLFTATSYESLREEFTKALFKFDDNAMIVDMPEGEIVVNATKILYIESFAVRED